jgi:hypothetical protein
MVVQSRPKSSKVTLYDLRKSELGSDDFSELKIFPATCGSLRSGANKAFNRGQSHISQSNVILCSDV